MNEDAQLNDPLPEAARLPRSIEPPVDLWPSILDRINQRKVVEGRFPAGAKRPWWAQAPALAAAAVLLVTLSSLVTAVVVRRPPAGLSAGPSVADPARAFTLL